MNNSKGLLDEKTVQKMISGGEIKRDTLGLFRRWRFSLDSSERIVFSRFATRIFCSASVLLMKYQLNKSDDGARLEIRLNSGVELKIKAVRLYDDIALAKVNSKRAEAMKMFKGVSTGIGPWGSIEWVLAASAVIGAVDRFYQREHLASSVPGLPLKRRFKQERKLRKEGVFFPVSKIQSY